MSDCVDNYIKLFLIIRGPATQALRALMTYYLQEHNLTFQEFIDRNQHEIYHLSSNRKCCQCKKESIFQGNTPILSSQMEILFNTNSQITSSSNKRKDNHDYSRKDKCCCFAKSKICVNGLDITLLNILLVKFCDLFFWTCFLNAENSGSFKQFLKNRQHELFHLWEPKVTCCECNEHRNTYKRPKISAISRQEFESLYTFDRNVKKSGCTLDDTCAYSAKQGISQTDIKDPKLFQTIIKCLCPHRLAIKGIVETRNTCLHKTDITEGDFNVVWETLKDSILKIEFITVSQLWTEESINRLKTKLETENILNEIKTNLEKVTNSHEALLNQMVDFKRELRKTELRKRELMKLIKKSTDNKPSQSLTSLSHRNYKESSICLHPKQLKLKLSTQHMNDIKEDAAIEDAENRLKENCHNLKLSFRNETPRNGNCLFEAVASQLSDLGIREMSAQEMRQEVIEYLMENRDFQGVDGSVNIEHFIDDRPFEDWASNMRQNSVFADHIVVVGIANMLQTNMLIVTSNPQSNPDNCMTHIVGSRNYQGVPILLGHVWENHYYSLISVDAYSEKGRLEENTLELCEMHSQHQRPIDGSFPEDDDEVVSADINVTLTGGVAIREMKIKGKVTTFAPAVQTIETPHSSSNSQLSNINEDEDSESDEDNLFMCGRCNKIFTTNESLEEHQKKSVSCRRRKRKKEKTSDTSDKSSKRTQNLTSGEPKKKRLKLKIKVEGERDETVPAWEERVKRVQRICTGELDDDDVTVEYVEEGSLVFWTKANAPTVQSKRKFAESMDRFMVNLIDKCPIDPEEEANFSIKVDVIESSEDEDTDNDDESNLYICGRCKVIFKSFSSFTNHKRNCNLRRTKKSKDQHHVDDDHDDSGKGQKRKEKDREFQLFSQESSALSDTTESEEHSFASSGSLSSRKESVVDRLKASFKYSSTDTTSGYETDKERENQKNIQHEKALNRFSEGDLKETSKHSSMLKDTNNSTEDDGYMKPSKRPLDYKSTKYVSAKQRRTLKKLRKRSTSNSSDKDFGNEHIIEINLEWNDEEEYSHYYNQINYSSDEHLEDSSVIDIDDEVCSDSGGISAQDKKLNVNKEQKNIKVKEDYYEKSKALAANDRYKKLFDTQMIQYGLNLSERCLTSLKQKFRRRSNKYKNFYTPFIEDKSDLETKCNDDPGQFRKGTLEIRSSHEAICTLEKPLNGVETVEISGRSKCGKAFTDDEVVVQIYHITGRTTFIPRIGKEIPVSELFGEVIGCLKRNRYNEISHPVFVCELDKFEYDKAKPICRTLPKFHLLSENKEDCPFSVDIYRYNENTRAISYDKSLPVSPALRQRYLFYVAYVSWNSLYPLGAIIKVHESTKVFETGLKILELQNSVPTLYSNETINYVDFDIKYMDDKSKRIDLTEECNVFTIDPVGSKVLDDAVSIKELNNGEWRVGVHITDVSVFIEQNCALDYEARERGTTFFRGQFGDPHQMLPEPISTKRCSLVASHNRLALTIFFHFDKALKCIHRNTKCFKSIIHSSRQLSYENVQDIIVNDSPSPLKKEVTSLFEIAKSLRIKRLGNGMFSIPYELEFFQNKENSTNCPEAYFLIEELMILTNHSVARYLMRTFPDCIPLRCQDPPSKTNLTEFLAKYPKVVDMVLAFQHYPHEGKKKICIDNFFDNEGFTKLRSSDITYAQKWLWKSVIDHLQAGNNRKAAELLRKEELHPFHALVIHEWQSIQNQAEYRCSGYIQGVKGKHFNLGMFPYTHFTAPIRRFTDLVVHRLLHAAIDGKPSPYSCEEIHNICHNVNTALHRAQEYNNQCKSYLLAHTLQSDPHIFHAFVEDCNEKEITLLIPGCNFLKKHCKKIKLNLLGVSEQPKFKKDIDKLNSAANRKYMILTWKDRIYSRFQQKPYPKNPFEGYTVSKKGYPQKIDPNQKIDFKQMSVWLEYIKCIIDNKELLDLNPEGDNFEPGERLSKSFLHSSIDTEDDVNSEIIDPTKKIINAGKIFITDQFCNFSMNFHHGQVVAVQLSSEMQKGLLTPYIEILDMTRNVKYCLKHIRDPIGCFEEFSTTTTKSRYKDCKEYKDTWTPIMKMETAMTVVRDSTIVVNDLQIRFDAQGGNFILRSDFSFERNIDLSATTVYGVGETETEWVQNSDYLCIKCPVSAASGEFLHIRKSSAPHDYKIWTNHAKITRVSKLRKNTDDEQLKVYFEFIKDEEQPLSTAKKPICSVEIIPKSELNKRVEIVLDYLDKSTDLAEAIALNRKTKPIDQDHTKAISNDDIDIGLPWNNEQQAKAIHLALSSSFSLIHGPPGTGKTNVGIKLVCLFNEINKKIEQNGGDRMQILYCGPSNKSVDLVASRLLRMAGKKEKMPKIARLYGNSIENLDYPIPGRVCSTKRTNTDNKADDSLKAVSLHHLIRKPGKPFSEKILSMYIALTQTFVEVITTISDKVKMKTPVKKEKKEVKQVVDMATLKDYNQLVNDATIEELKLYDVIFCTTAMSTNPKLLKGTDGRIYQVIIDESGMCTEPECMSTIIATKAKQVVLIGDHKQLQPVVVCPQARQLGLQKSLFERYKTDSHFVPLTTQYRMHPSILEFPARRFYEKYDLKTDKESRSYVEEQPLQVWFSENKRTVFCHVEGVEETLPVSTEEGNEMSRRNTAEVAQVLKIYRHLHKKEEVFTTKGKKNEITINIMSQYNAQCGAIRSALEKAKFKDVNVNTVVSSQGGEWDYVIFSLARSLPDYIIEKRPTLGWCAKNLGFITDEHQINVALTRARKGLFIIGNKNLLKCDKTWKDLINTYDRKGCVVNGNEYPWPYEPQTRKKKRPKHKHEVDNEGYQQV